MKTHQLKPAAQTVPPEKQEMTDNSIPGMSLTTSPRRT